MNGTNFTGLLNGQVDGVSGGFLAALLAGFVAGYVVLFLKKITEKLPKSVSGLRPMLIYPLGGVFVMGVFMCGINRSWASSTTYHQLAELPGRHLCHPAGRCLCCYDEH